MAEEEDFYILPYYFDDEGVLKSRVKVGDYITIESEGNSSQKQVLEVKILKSGTRYLLEAREFLPVLLYSIITNDNKQYGKIIISEGTIEERFTKIKSVISALGVTSPCI